MTGAIRKSPRRRSRGLKRLAIGGIGSVAVLGSLAAAYHFGKHSGKHEIMLSKAIQTAAEEQTEIKRPPYPSFQRFSGTPQAI